jgi:hypothetical protein
MQTAESITNVFLKKSVTADQGGAVYKPPTTVIERKGRFVNRPSLRKNPTS